MPKPILANWIAFALGRGVFMNNEIWKIISIGNKSIEVSNLGNIRNPTTHAPIKTHLNRGYPAMCVYINGRQKTFKVHRLVLLAFIGPSNLPVDHINMDRKDNRLENLEYVTHRENSKRGKRVRKKSNLPSNVYKNGKRFSVRFQYNGKCHHFGNFFSIKDADEHARKIENDIENIINYKKSRIHSKLGIGISKYHNKFKATVNYKSKIVYLGLFNTIEEGVEEQKRFFNNL